MASSFITLLQYNWFILGLDGHIQGDIHQSQQDGINERLEQPKYSHLAYYILVIHQPFWLMCPTESNLDIWLSDNCSNLYKLLFTEIKSGCGQKFKLVERIKLILAGDYHFYHRQNIKLGGNDITAIVAGGGGSFKHLTFFL